MITFIKSFSIGDSRKFSKYQVEGVQQLAGTQSLTLYDGVGLYGQDQITIPGKDLKSSLQKDEGLEQFYLQSLEDLNTKLENLQSELRQKLLNKPEEKTQ